MMLRLAAILAVTVVVAGFRDAPPPWPASGPMPDEPVPVPASRYHSVTEGTQSFRPVAPLPWSDVNRRIAPPAPAPKEPPAKGP